MKSIWILLNNLYTLILKKNFKQFTIKTYTSFSLNSLTLFSIVINHIYEIMDLMWMIHVCVYIYMYIYVSIYSFDSDITWNHFAAWVPTLIWENAISQFCSERANNFFYVLFYSESTIQRELNSYDFEYRECFFTRVFLELVYCERGMQAVFPVLH